MKLLAPLLAVLAAPLAAQMLPVSGHIQDGQVAVVAGIISFTPTLCNGQPTAYQLAGAGEFSAIPFTAPIKDGFFSLVLPNVAASTPHICFSAVAVNTQTGATLLRAGYATMQPMPGAFWCPSVNGAPACNFDLYLPTFSAQPATPPASSGASGPIGPQGATGAQGPQGASGPAGPPGLTGAIGATGAVGATGLKGDAGPMGPLGPVGPVGPKGDLGPAGAQGIPGIPGQQGVSGPQGMAGVAGPIGPAGQTGNPGPAGIPGTKGDQGITGPIGPQGVTGATGSAGATGAQGIPGAAGAPGAAGPAGAIGATGPTGGSGAKGDPGTPGVAGPGGASGPKGDSGAQGLQGVPGTPGPAGTNGSVGPTGPAGTPGPAGITGAKGDPGAQGGPGIAGPTGPVGPTGPPGASGSGVADGSVSALAANTASNGQPSNGIANADVAPNQFITISPSYGYSDPLHLIPTQSGTTFHDTRPGFAGDRFRNCLAQSGFIGIQNACNWNHVTFDSRANSPSGNQTLRHESVYAYGKGNNYSSAWTVTTLSDNNVICAVRGICNGFNLTFRGQAKGDKNVLNIYNWFDGGSSTQSDEFVVGYRAYNLQNLAYYHGTSLSAGPAGTVLMPSMTDSTVSPAPGSQQPDANHTTDGGILLDLSNPQIAGTITGPGVPVPGSAYLTQFPTAGVSGGLPLATAYGKCGTTIPLPSQAGTYFSYTATCTIFQGAFVAGHHVWITGPNYPEEAVVASVGGAPSGGTQTVTFTIVNGQPGGSGLPVEVVQDSTVGYYVSFDANLAKTGMRSTYYAFGSLDGTNLIVGFYLQGGPSPMPRPGAQAFTPGVTGLNGFHLIKGAEVLANLSIQHDPLLATHGIVFAQGDLLEAPPPVAVNLTGIKLQCGQNSPVNGAGSICDYVGVAGAGAVANFQPRLTANYNDPAMYTHNGGWADGMTMHTISGYYDFGETYVTAPGRALRTVLNMSSSQTRGGTLTLDNMPSGGTFWDDTNRRFGAPAFIGDGSALTGLTASQVTGLGAAATHGPAITINGTACALDGTCTLPGGGGSGGGLADPGGNGLVVRTGLNTTRPATFTDVQTAAAGDPSATQITGGVGTGAKAGQVPIVPGTALAALIICQTSSGVAVLDSNGLVQWCVQKSDGSQTPIPSLDIPSIRALMVAADPLNCTAGGDWSQFWRDGKCSPVAGAIPQTVGYAQSSFNNSGPATFGQSYTNAGANAFDLIWVISTQNANTATITPVTLSDSTGATATSLGSAADPTGVYISTAFAVSGAAVGAHTFTATAATGVLQMGVYEFRGAPTANAFESAAVRQYGSAVNATCPVITTTGGNELAVNLLFGFGATYTSTTGYTSHAAGSQLMEFTNNLTVATTQTPAYTTNGASVNTSCVSLAIKHN